MTAEWYAAPTSIAEAVDLLRRSPDALIVAGGTDLMPRLRRPRARVSGLTNRPFVSLRRVNSLDDVQFCRHRLSIGSVVTHARIATDSILHSDATALVDVAVGIGSPAVRAWGTIGGTIANASRSMDAGPALLVLGAEIEIVGAGYRRKESFADFLFGSHRTSLSAGEVIETVTLRPTSLRTGSAFVKQGVRRVMDIAIATAGAKVVLDHENVIQQIELAVGNIGPLPVLLSELSDSFVGVRAEDAIRDIPRAVENAVAVNGDGRVPDDYRKAVCGQLAARAFKLACDRVVTQGV